MYGAVGHMFRGIVIELFAAAIIGAGMVNAQAQRGTVDGLARRLTHFQ